MLNRWQGNTGKVQRIDDKLLERREIPRKPPPTQAQVPGIENMFGKIIRKIPGVRESLDSEDIILLLILYLMYRESGDSELLVIMGAMFLL